MTDYVPFVVCRLWLIPDVINIIERMAFPTELNCLRQILQPRIILITLFLFICAGYLAENHK